VVVSAARDNRSVGSLLVVSGPPGAGKSTVARILANRAARSVLVEGDAFFGFLVNGAIEPWLAESREQNEVVTRVAASAAGLFASSGYWTVYDGVVGPWSLPAFSNATGLDRMDYVILLPSVDHCVERVATRLDHGFGDEAATRKMHTEFAIASVDARHVLVDPPEIPDDVAAVIDEAANKGTLAYRCR
jgi:hypothetical protein